MNITEAQYMSHDGENIAIVAVIDGVTMGVPLDPNNRHYAEILRMVAEDDLVIADAE